jgi:integrase/recombinase XerD
MKRRPGKAKDSKDPTPQIPKGGELMPLPKPVESLIPTDQRDSLVAWFSLYMAVEAGASADNTFKAKRRDLEGFLNYFRQATGSDRPDLWTRSLSAGYLKALAKAGKAATTTNRVLATLRHCAAWIHRQRPFLAGNPTDRIHDLDVDDPTWKGLSDLEVTRLRAAAEQLLHLKTAKNQNAVRDHALFLVLLHTGLRISELLALNLTQYHGKHFHDVKRKGKKVSRKVFLPKDAKEALDRYLDEVRGRNKGPLFTSRSGERLQRQNVDDTLKALANQANAQLPEGQKIKLSAHILRHTLLRKAAEKHGVHYAMELAGHTSSQYIWRYVKPTDEQKEQAQEELF